MIFFNFTIRNPFKTKDVGQKDYICWEKRITTNKCLEIQLSKWSKSRIFEISLDTCWIGQDHGGIRFDIELLGYFFNIGFFDHRHWDYDNHCWETEDTDV